MGHTRSAANSARIGLERPSYRPPPTRSHENSASSRTGHGPKSDKHALGEGKTIHPTRGICRESPSLHGTVVKNGPAPGLHFCPAAGMSRDEFPYRLKAYASFGASHLSLTLRDREALPCLYSWHQSCF